MFRINHLIIGTTDVAQSEAFYTALFGFQSLCSFVDTGTGNEGKILRLQEDPEQCLELLLVPFIPERLPSPQHIAFEVDASRFHEIHQRAISLGFRIRGHPALTSPESAPGNLEVAGFCYRNFYVLDPMRINIEVMTRE